MNKKTKIGHREYEESTERGKINKREKKRAPKEEKRTKKREKASTDGKRRHFSNIKSHSYPQ